MRNRWEKITPKMVSLPPGAMVSQIAAEMVSSALGLRQLKIVLSFTTPMIYMDGAEHNVRRLNSKIYL